MDDERWDFWNCRWCIHFVQMLWSQQEEAYWKWSKKLCQATIITSDSMPVLTNINENLSAFATHFLIVFNTISSLKLSSSWSDMKGMKSFPGEMQSACEASRPSKTCSPYFDKSGAPFSTMILYSIPKPLQFNTMFRKDVIECVKITTVCTLHTFSIRIT